MWYHNVRGADYNLHNAEKCTGIASVCCLALSLALGPLSRFCAQFDWLLPCRRTLGIIGAIGSIPHVLLALFCLPNKFPMSWFADHGLTTVAGAFTLILFLAIAGYSCPQGFERLGKRKWMILQKLAYLVMILLILHLLSLGKIPKNWIAWFETRDKPLPPGSFPVMMICISTLVLKVLDLFSHGDSLARTPGRENSPPDPDGCI